MNLLIICIIGGILSFYFDDFSFYKYFIAMCVAGIYIEVSEKKS